MDQASSHVQIKVSSGIQQNNACESVKTNLVVANVCGLMSALMFFCFTAESDLNEFLLMLSLILFGLWQGAQVCAEEVYIHNSIDKRLVTETNDKMLLAEIVGGLGAAGFSFLLAMYAQPKVGASSADFVDGTSTTTLISWNPTMRTAYAVAQIGTCVLMLVCSVLMFNEIHHADRQQYRRVKRKLKQMTN